MAILTAIVSFVHRTTKTEELANASKTHADRIGALESRTAVHGDALSSIKDDLRYIRDRVDSALNVRKPDHRS